MPRDDVGCSICEDHTRVVLLRQAAHTDEPLVQSVDLQHLVEPSEPSFARADHDLAAGPLDLLVGAAGVLQRNCDRAEVPCGATVHHESSLYAR